MDIRSKGIQTQIKSIEASAGKRFDELKAEVLAWGELSHFGARAKAQDQWNLSLMHADTLIYCARMREQSLSEAAAEWYAGPKSAFRPIHDRLMDLVGAWDGVEAVPKKGYVSMRVKKQFAAWGPTTNTRFEVGLNGKTLAGSARLQPIPPGGICHFKVALTKVEEVDEELLDWLKAAWEGVRR